MQNDLQIWQLILAASWMVKMVMAIHLKKNSGPAPI
jgi:hypothetical protein